mgnify:CR=1 FL=1
MPNNTKFSWEYLNALLDRWRNHPVRRLANGTELICPVPHVAPEAWLHEIHGRLDYVAINALEREFKRPIPKALREFYKEANGLHLFSDEISVYGRRTSFDRNGEGTHQPYCLVTQNGAGERFPGCPNEFVFIGGYSDDGSNVAITSTESQEVLRLEPATGREIARWPSIWVWICSEADRYDALFDDEGRMKPGAG